jgi:HlyD family secretion protein
VEVTTDSRPDAPYAGRVGFISPVAEFTPKSVETEALRTDLVYRLRIVVEDADDGLRQGMPVTVTLPSGGADAPAAPAAPDARTPAMSAPRLPRPPWWRSPGWSRPLPRPGPRPWTA